jgi:hypothetical protein
VADTTNVERVEPFAPERRADVLGRAEQLNRLESARRELAALERDIGVAPSGRVAQLEAENAALRRQVRELTTFHRLAADAMSSLLAWRPPGGAPPTEQPREP